MRITRNQDLCSFCGGSLGNCWRSEVFSRCRRCGFIQRRVQPSQEELDAYYATAWSEPDRFSGGTGEAGAVMMRQYRSELLKSLQRPDAQGLRILDFGAGRGALLKALQEAGAEVYAVEPYGGEHLSASGLRSYPTLDDLPEGLLFDGIITKDVVEHLLRPWEDIRRLYERLVPGGWLFISTPNPASIRARVRGAKWSEARTAGHICFMDARTLTAMLKKAGFSSVKTLRWHIHHQRHRLRRKITHRLLTTTGMQVATRVLAFK